MNTKEKEARENSSFGKAFLPKKRFLVAAIAIAAVFLIVAVGSARADRACVADDGSGDAYFCGDTVMKSCTLNGSMSCSSGHGLVIGADDITINGAGYKIIGSENATICATVGQNNPQDGICGIINSNGYDNVIIKNIDIENFCVGIGLVGPSPVNLAENNTIYNCKIHDNGNDTAGATHGIHMLYTNNCTINMCNIYNNTGVGCGCGGGGNGIFMYGGAEPCGNYNEIIFNKIYNNKKGGFFMKMMCMYNNISHNSLSGNGAGGIILRCMMSNYNIIEYNNASNNYGTGIFLRGSSNTIKYNIINNNMNGSWYATHCSIGTPAYYVAKYGVGIKSASDTGPATLINNIVCGNDAWDIEDVRTDGGAFTGDENTCDSTFNYNDEGTTGCTYPCFVPSLFDTDKGTYPSIFGTHKGKIIPDKDITVNRMYTYPCKGTGGHAEYVRIWNESEAIEGIGNWSGYRGDYHNITISPAITLLKNHEYDYTIITDSYPQIIHAREHKAGEGGNITCVEFVDANNRRYDDWIPAIRLFFSQVFCRR